MLSLPGLRVFADARFRTLVAGLLFGLAVITWTTFLAGRAAMPLTEGQFGIDFADYFAAADRLAATGSPYAPEMLDGPVSAQGLDRYRYPPPLAQVLVPATAVGLTAATTAWFVVQLACVVTGVVVAARAGGVRLTVEAALWLGVATAWFMPIVDALWKGNVSGIQVLLVASLFASAAIGGLATAVNATLKLVASLLAPIVVIRGRAGASALAIGLIAIVLPSIVVAPLAWRDFLVVLSNLLGGSPDYAANLAPDAVARTLGLADPSQIVRWLSFGSGFLLLITGVDMARRDDGWPAAAVLGTTGLLLLPPVLWYHYLVVLLPVAIIAWRPASARGRTLLVAGGLSVTFGIAWLPITLAGAVVMVGASLRAVWPSSEQTA